MKFLAFASLVFTTAVVGGDSASVTPNDLYGKWEGFAATPSKNMLSVVRLKLEFKPDGHATAAERNTTRPDREEIDQMSRKEQTQTRMNLKRARESDRATRHTKRLFSELDDSGLALEGDEPAATFLETLSVTVEVEPLYFLHPGFEKLPESNTFNIHIKQSISRLAGQAKSPAALHTETGQLRFGPRFEWIDKPRDDVVRPTNLKLIFDGEKGILFGELLNANTAAARKQFEAPMQPVFMPVMLWKAGSVPQEIMDRIAEEVNLVRSRPDYRLMRDYQEWAVARANGEIADEKESVVEEQPRRDDAGRAPSRSRSAPLAEEENEESENPLLRQLRARAAETAKNAAAIKALEIEATRAYSAARKARKGTTGADRDAADAQVDEAKAVYLDARQATVSANRERDEAAKALKTEERRIRNEQSQPPVVGRGPGGGREPSPSPQPEPKKPVVVKKPKPGEIPLPDIETTEARVHAWVEHFAGEVPEYVVDGKVVFDRFWWPNSAQNLFEDSVLTKAFGQTLPEWSPGDRAMIVKAFERSTNSSRARDDAVLVLENHYSKEFISAIDNELEGNFARTLARYFHLAHSRSYLERLTKRMTEVEPDQLTFFRLQAWGELVEENFGYLWPSEFLSGLDAIENSMTENADAVLLSRVNAAARTFESDMSGGALLAHWWGAQDTLFNYASDRGIDRANQRLNDGIDEVLERHLVPLVDQISELGRGLEAVQGGSDLYRQARGVVGLATDRPSYEQFISKMKDRRNRDLEKALPEIEEQLSKIRSIRNVDRFEANLLGVPSDLRSKGGRAVAQLANDRRSEIDEELLKARFSKREQDMMTVSGHLDVPSEYGPPTGEEIKFARYREFGRPHPTNPNKVIVQSFMQSLMNLSMEVEIFDVEVRAVAPAEDGYWVVYKYKQKTEPQGWIVDDVDPFEAKMIRSITKLGEIVPAYTFDKFELTPSGWRSSTLRVDAMWDHSYGNLNRKRTIEEEIQEIRREASKAKMSPQERAKFAEEVSNVRLWYVTYKKRW